MEDFLLRGRKRSPTGIHALRLLKQALDCDSTHAKAWYRFGFLLHRQAQLPAASEGALEHAVSLKPSSSGPALAELTLLKLNRLMDASTPEEEAHLASAAKQSHAEAMKHNPSLTVHVLQAVFGEEAAKGSFADVIAIAMEERQARQARQASQPAPQFTLQPPAPVDQGRHQGPAATARDGAGIADRGARPAFSVGLRACDETRARRDVLRLRGEDEAAEIMTATLEAELAGRELPPPIYEKPQR